MDTTSSLRSKASQVHQHRRDLEELAAVLIKQGRTTPEASTVIIELIVSLAAVPSVASMLGI